MKKKQPSGDKNFIVIQLFNTIGSGKKSIRIKLPENTTVRVLKEKIAEYYGDLDTDDFELTYIGTGNNIRYIKMEGKGSVQPKKRLKRVKTGNEILDDTLSKGDITLHEKKSRKKSNSSNSVPENYSEKQKKTFEANRREPSIKSKKPDKTSGKIVINVKNTVGPSDGKKDKLRITLPEDTPIKIIKKKIADYYNIDEEDFNLAHVGKG